MKTITNTTITITNTTTMSDINTNTDNSEISQESLAQLHKNNIIAEQNAKMFEELTLIRKLCESMNERLINLEKRIDKTGDFVTQRAKTEDINMTHKRISDVKTLIIYHNKSGNNAQVEKLKTELAKLEPRLAQMLANNQAQQ